MRDYQYKKTPNPEGGHPIVMIKPQGMDWMTPTEIAVTYKLARTTVMGRIDRDECWADVIKPTRKYGVEPMVNDAEEFFLPESLTGLTPCQIISKIGVAR